MKNKENKISPLDELHLEKELIRRECAEGEDRLAEHWSYISTHAGSIIFSTAISNVSRKLGLAPAKDKEHGKAKGGSFFSSGLFQGLIGSLIAAAPLVLDVAQPVIVGFLVKKITSLFTGKKKN